MATMTLDEFLRHLSYTTSHINWAHNPHVFTFAGALRGVDSDGRRHCPISAVTGDHKDFMCPRRAGSLLGLHPQDIDKIVQASDIPGLHTDVRKKLMRAVGLLPETTLT